ncbi:hypothetical protein B0H16DRAFT_1895880 [Mycena metata]|uniref:F-box domain-containing protein n=1 Tax=Mycena metata TaxID=1033252 RepID=A0AAD7HL50_9AGAR|nr:hypothetical protein B0H16DRAFT_1895880 [Mycena metata]
MHAFLQALTFVLVAVYGGFIVAASRVPHFEGAGDSRIGLSAISGAVYDRLAVGPVAATALLQAAGPGGRAIRQGTALAWTAAPIVANAVKPIAAAFLSRLEDRRSVTAPDFPRHGGLSAEAALVHVGSPRTHSARRGAYARSGSVAASFFGTIFGRRVRIDQIADLGLPTEVLSEVFSLAVGTYDPTNRVGPSSVQSQLAIASVCKYWSYLVHGLGCLWSTFEVNPYQLEAPLLARLSRLHRTPIDLTLHFDDLFSLYHPRSTLAAPRLGVRDTILRVGPLLGSCRRLCIAAEDSFAFPLLLEILRFTSGALLVSLSLSRISFAFLEGRIAAPNLSPVLYFFSGVPLLRFLRLDNVCVGWEDRKYYAVLEVLDFRHMRAPINPPSVALYALLAAAPFLVRLSLDDIECGPLPPWEHPFFTCGYLVELYLHLTGTIGVANVLSRCLMPALHTLTLVLDAEFDLRCILACASLLERVVVLTLQATGLPRETISELWISVPLLQVLDLSAAGLLALDALYTPNGPFFTVHHCPRLSTLTVSDVSPSVMRRFVQRRADDGLRLQRLTMYRAVDFFESSELDVEWLLDFFGPDAFAMDPEFDCSGSLKWREH